MAEKFKLNDGLLTDTDLLEQPETAVFCLLVRLMQFDLGEYVLPVSRAAVHSVHGYVLALGKLIALYRTRFFGSQRASDQPHDPSPLPPARVLDDTRYALDELEMLHQHLTATAIPLSLLLNEAMLRLASAYRAKAASGSVHSASGSTAGRPSMARRSSVLEYLLSHPDSGPKLAAQAQVKPMLVPTQESDEEEEEAPPAHHDPFAEDQSQSCTSTVGGADLTADTQKAVTSNTKVTLAIVRNLQHHYLVRAAQGAELQVVQLAELDLGWSKYSALDVVALLQFLQAVAPALYTVMRYYTSEVVTEPATLTMVEWLALIVDAKVRTAAVDAKACAEYFVDVMTCSKASGARLVLTLPRLCEALVVLATGVFDEDQQPLSQRVQRLCLDFVFRFCCRPQPGKFKGDLRDANVLATLQLHTDTLLRVFCAYATPGLRVKGHKGRQPGIMNLAQLQALARDAQLYSPALTPKRFLSVFAAVQQDEGEVWSGAGGTGGVQTTLVFSEFRELLCAVAVFKNPDPFTPLYQRLHMYASMFRECVCTCFVCPSSNSHYTPAPEYAPMTPCHIYSSSPCPTWTFCVPSPQVFHSRLVSRFGRPKRSGGHHGAHPVGAADGRHRGRSRARCRHVGGGSDGPLDPVQVHGRMINLIEPTNDSGHQGGSCG